MRSLIAALPLLALTACGGSSGPLSVGSVAPPAGTGTAAPTPTATDVYAQFANPVDPKTYAGIGGSQVYDYLTDDRNCCNQQGEKYGGSLGTVRNSPISLTYDPRNAIFTLTVNDPQTGANTNTRFQDPANRTDFGGAVEPQWGTPRLTGLTGPLAQYNNPNINFLQAGDGNPLSPYSWSGTGYVDIGNNTTPPMGNTPSTYTSTTFFYEKPGTNTKYVTFAGYLRNQISFAATVVGGRPTIVDTWHLERGAFAYGAQTSNGAVPITGTGSFKGAMLATMVYNPTLDGKVGDVLPTYFQWLTGTSTLNVDFASKKVDLALAGVVLGGQYDRYTSPNRTFLPEGTTFAAAGSATIDMVNRGGFTGSFAGGNFTFTNGGTATAVNIAGSSIDGTFFGPAAQEAGGGFRVVGGTPDQRIDILGAFSGKR